MRKALIGLIVAATALTPIAAQAQRGHRDRGADSESRAEQRVERMEQRNEARQQRQEQRAQPQPQVQQVAQRDRGGDGNRGNRGGGDRNWRGGGDNQDSGNRRGGGERGNRGGTRQPSVYPDAWQGNPNSPDLRRYQRLERQNQQRGNDGRRGDRDWRDNDGRRGDRNWRDNDGRNWRGGDRNWRGGDRDWRGDRRRWDRNWRNDRRYDWRGWRTRNRSTFRIGPYYSPYRNWGYNRFSIGIFLEPLFYNQRYWIGDPWQYRLPPAYPGTQWVRYYDDVLLVDVYTGEVIDVIYDFFW